MANPKRVIERVPSRATTTYGNERDTPKRVPFGLGRSPQEWDAIGRKEGKVGLADRAANQCMTCGFGNVPVTEEVVWTIVTPMTSAQVIETFGDVVNLFSPSGSVAGVNSIDSTFLVNGILQTDLYCTGIGIHVFVEPITFSAPGNGWLAPEGAATPPPPSPDVFTVNDLAVGALGGITTGIVPATLDWGSSSWEAAWNFINAYQLQLRTNQRELMLNELLADVSYFASFGDVTGAGDSDVSVVEYAALVNAQYRIQGSPYIFLPTNFRRYGSVQLVGETTTSAGVFHATRDFDSVPATRGGPKVQGVQCCGGMYRKIERPCYFERGIPIGPQFAVVDPVHQARFQAALSIDSMTGSQNLLPDVNVGITTIGGGNSMLEQTLDATPVNVVQQISMQRQVFTGGIFKIGVKLKGWEMPGPWKQWMTQNCAQVFNGSPPQGPGTIPTLT
jgi:hypothetical protein